MVHRSVRKSKCFLAFFCLSLSISLLLPLQAESFKGKKINARVGTYAFSADYDLCDLATGQLFTVKTTSGVSAYSACKCAGRLISPGGFSVRLRDEQGKEFVEVMPTTTSALRYKTIQKFLTAKNDLLKKLGAVLCGKSLPIDEVFLGRKVYKIPDMPVLKIKAATHSTPRFRAFYQLQVISSKHKRCRKVFYARAETYRIKKTGDLISKLKFFADGDGGSSSKSATITFLHTKQGSREIEHKNFRKQKHLRKWMKVLAKKNRKGYRLFYNMHKQITEI